MKWRIQLRDKASNFVPPLHRNDNDHLNGRSAPFNQPGLGLVVGSLMFIIATNAQPFPQGLPSDRDNVAAYEAGEAGPHHRMWRKVVERFDPGSGRIVRTTNDAYVELASGLHYLDETDSRWRESVAAFEISPEGYAVARRGQTKVIISPLLGDVRGAVDMEGRALGAHFDGDLSGAEDIDVIVP